MFSHLFLTRLKVLSRRKELIFWTFLFPILLATFFNLAFSNLGEAENFNAIDIAVVADDAFFRHEIFVLMLESISNEADDTRLFNIIYVDQETDAKEMLINNEIAGYYVVNETIEIIISGGRIAGTIMRNVVDSYHQTASIIGNIIDFNPQALNIELINQINAGENFFRDVSNENVDFTVIYFYTLIGMLCLYAGFFGGDTVNETQANLSKKAARVTMSGVHKLRSLFASLLADFVLAYTQLLLVLAYIIFILGIDFGNQTSWVMLLGVIGICAGLAFGTLIGVSNRKSEGTKSAILIAITMSCSFLAGMMIWNMRYIVESYVPFINRINPVALITDALYSLYYFDTLDRYFTNLIYLGLITLVMIVISYFFIRRKKYDSI